MSYQRQWWSVFLASLLLAKGMEAGVMSKALQEAAEYAGKKFARETMEEGVEKLSSKMTRLAAKYGDDLVAAAVRKIGPHAGRVVTETTEHGDLALRLLAQHGDAAVPLVGKATALRTVAMYGEDAATAILRHGSVGEDLIGTFAQQGAAALAKVTPQSGRRLAMLAGEGTLKPELIEIVTQYGDAACEFIWRNKGSLAAGTAFTAFVAAPGEFLDGTRKLVEPIAEVTLPPIAEVPGIVAAEAAKSINWTLVSLVLIGVMTLVGYCRWWRVPLRSLGTGRYERPLQPR